MRSPLYYIQMNIFCIFVLIIMVHNLPRATVEKRDQKIYRFAMNMCIFFCGADVVTWLVNGQQFAGAVFLNYLSNIVYYLSSAFICEVWLIYVLIKVSGVPKGINTKHIRLSIPYLIFAVLVLITPYTGMIFTVDPVTNIYHRGAFVVLHWLVSYGYGLAAAIITIKVIKKTDSKLQKAEYMPMSLFMIPPIITSAIQILFEGASLIPMGFTMSLLIIFVRLQNAQISIDVLTNTNNRGQLDRYLRERFQLAKPDDEVFMIMMDVNKFKGINDTYGHLMGDDVLVAVAHELKELCGTARRGIFLARYGGDEFVIVNCGQNICNPEDFIEQINDAIFNMNRQSKFPFEVTISAGFAKGLVSEFETQDDLIKKADEAMYAVKKQR